MESKYEYQTEYGKGKIHYYYNEVTGEVSTFDAKIKVPKPKQFRQFEGDDFWIVDVDSNFNPIGVRK